MLNQLKATPIVPVFYHKDTEYAQQILSACYEGGLRFFEFTNRGTAALEVFMDLKRHTQQHCPGLSLGIGTIYTPEEARMFIEAGADFVVQPVTTAGVGLVCREAGVPWIPGAMTLNEVWGAWQLGATVVKLFPGSMFGPEYVRALRGPMPNVPLMVTGGVEPTVESISAWLSAGVQAVGIGSQLFGGKSDALAQRLSELLKNTSSL